MTRLGIPALLIATLIVIAARSSSINAQNTTPAVRSTTSKTATLELSVAVPIEHIPFGQKPWVHLTVKNLGNEEIAYPRERVYVEGPKGEPPTTLVQRSITGRLKPGDTPIPPTGFSPLIALAGWPGDTFTMKYDLSYLYKFKELGKGVQATAARMSQETVAAQDMLTRFVHWQGRTPESVAADTTYGNGEFLQWLADRSITPYMRTRDNIHRKNSPFYGPERFTYQPEHNRYICPAGQPLNYGGRNLRNRTYAYIGTRKRCGACALKAQCTSGAFRFLAIHMDEPARQRARELANTPEFAHAQRQRKKVEALFAELKNQIGLRRLRLRRLKFVREQFFLAVAAQNIKRLVRFLSQAPPSILPATT